MRKTLPYLSLLVLLTQVSHASELSADTLPTKAQEERKIAQKSTLSKSKFTSFTGKIVGNNVRMRAFPALDSHVVSELSKEEYVVITGEKGEFYSVMPPKNVKAYIFRGFVIDGMVEGDRVNIRLAPDREAPIIHHYNSGIPIKGDICKENTKWLEISIPKDTRFYIAKEYVEYAGDAKLKKIHDKRKETSIELLTSAHLFSQSEMRKPFPEIDMEKIVQNYELLLEEYAEFPHPVTEATKALAEVREDYLLRKIAFLESKTSVESSQSPIQKNSPSPTEKPTRKTMSASDRMKIWEPIEEALYLSWSNKHHAKSMEDFYEEQKLKAQTIHGFLESYSGSIKNKPGDFIIKSRDIPIGYVYSTQVNLQSYVGKEVTLLVSPRDNHRFAFPAYYVVEVLSP